MSNGHFVELRISTEAMETADVPGHKLYEEMRSIKDKAKTENRDLTLEERTKFQEMEVESNRLYSQAWEELVKQDK